MSDSNRLTRRAAIGLIGGGALLSIAQSYGQTTTHADRLTNLSTVPDPSAYLGLSGIGVDPYDEISVINNTSSTPLDVTVTTSDFTIANDGDGGSDTEWTFSLSPGGTQTVQFSPETDNTDEVAFSATLSDGGVGVGSIDLSRSLTIPVTAGTTYRIKSVHSGLSLTGDSPSGGGFGPPEGNVYQDTWSGGTDQHWRVIADGAAHAIEHVSSGALLSLEFFGGGGDVTDVVTRNVFGGVDDDQRWVIGQYADETYRVENVDNGDVLDVEGESQSPGGNVITYPDKNNDAAVPNQKWVFEPL